MLPFCSPRTFVHKPPSKTNRADRRNIEKGYRVLTASLRVGLGRQDDWLRRTGSNGSVSHRHQHARKCKSFSPSVVALHPPIKLSAVAIPCDDSRGVSLRRSAKVRISLHLDLISPPPDILPRHASLNDYRVHCEKVSCRLLFGSQK